MASAVTAAGAALAELAPTTKAVMAAVQSVAVSVLRMGMDTPIGLALSCVRERCRTTVGLADWILPGAIREKFAQLT